MTLSCGVLGHRHTCGHRRCKPVALPSTGTLCHPPKGTDSRQMRGCSEGLPAGVSCSPTWGCSSVAAL